MVRWRTPGDLEKDLRKVGLELLLQVGLFAWVDYQPPKRGRKGAYQSSTGVADILGCHGGRMFAIEVKLPEGRQSYEQQLFQAKLEVAGGRYYLARSIEDFEAIAQDIKRNPLWLDEAHHHRGPKTEPC